MSDGTCPWVNGNSTTQGAKYIAIEHATDNGCTVPADDTDLEIRRPCLLRLPRVQGGISHQGVHLQRPAHEHRQRSRLQRELDSGGVLEVLHPVLKEIEQANAFHGRESRAEALAARAALIGGMSDPFDGWSPRNPHPPTLRIGWPDASQSNHPPDTLNVEIPKCVRLLPPEKHGSRSGSRPDESPSTWGRSVDDVDRALADRRMLPVV